MPQADWLVIGYGNELRGDDAAGPRVAAAVADWDLPNVRALSFHQLLPELAPILAEAGVVLFVDVALPSETPEFQARPVSPASAGTGLGHLGDPGALLTLTGTLFGRTPEAWLLLLPGHHFDFGEPLSPQTERAVDAALRWIQSRVLPDGTRRTSTPSGFTRSPALRGDVAPSPEELFVPAPRPHCLESSG